LSLDEFYLTCSVLEFSVAPESRVCLANLKLSSPEPKS
jgi:hypothetical protein